MSAGKIEVVAAYDAPLETPKEIVWSVKRGALNITYKQFNSVSLSDSQISFNCPPPNSNTFVSPYIKLDMSINLCSNYRCCPILRD